MNETATLVVGDGHYELPVVQGTEGEKAIDIRTLRDRTGLISLDPGYGNTGSCESAITYIDGERGILRYRGIPIEQFEKSPNYVEVAWLLIFGTLPSAEQYARFSAELTGNANIDEAMKHNFEGFPRAAPPMAILSAMINALSCFHPEFYELEEPGKFEAAAARLISKVRTIAAFAYRRSRGFPTAPGRPPAASCCSTARPPSSPPSPPPPARPISPSSRSRSSTARSSTPPGRSRGASSSARGARPTTRSSTAGSSIARSGRSSPRGSSTRCRSS